MQPTRREAKGIVVFQLTLQRPHVQGLAAESEAQASQRNWGMKGPYSALKGTRAEGAELRAGS